MPQLVTPRYYDIDDFLSQEDLVPVATEDITFDTLGHLKKDVDKIDLPPKTRLLLPVWAIEKWTSLKFIKLRLPKRYAQAAREAISADPLHFNITSNHFSSGKAVAKLSYHQIPNEADQLKESLLKVRREKFVWQTSTTALKNTSLCRHIPDPGWQRLWTGHCVHHMERT